MNTGTIIIRADASAQIGAGHFMRCLALAQAWKDKGGEAVFITACQNDNLLKRLRDEGFDINIIPDAGDWAATRTIIDKFPDAWVVLDGYNFDEDYQRRVKDTGHRLLVIDDTAHLKHYYADVVLNQNLGAERLKYSCEPYTRLLVGTDYALLRREFLSWRGWKREIREEAKRVLVTLGGSDPENHTLKVVQALQRVKISGLEASVVAGASNPNIKELEATVKQSRIPLQLLHNAHNMPELMARADIAISGGGSTCWEMAFMGLPNIILILADNQAVVAGELASAGAVKNMGLSNEVDSDTISQELSRLMSSPDIRREMSLRGQKLVDGLGTKRVIESTLAISGRN